MTKYQKRTFVLLEVMIALFIVSICLLPLITPHAWMMIEEKKALKELEKERDISILWAHFIEDIYRQKIPLQQLIQYQKIVLENQSTIVPEKIRWKKGKVGEWVYYIQFQLHLDGDRENSYPYSLTLIQKGGKPPSEETCEEEEEI